MQYLSFLELLSWQNKRKVHFTFFSFHDHCTAQCVAQLSALSCAPCRSLASRLADDTRTMYTRPVLVLILGQQGIPNYVSALPFLSGRSQNSAGLDPRLRSRRYPDDQGWHRTAVRIAVVHKQADR